MAQNSAGSRPAHTVLSGSAVPRSITKVNHAVTKAAFLQKLEFQSNLVREGWFADSHYDRCEEQLALVNQPRSKGVGSKLRTTDEDIMLGNLFQLLNCFWIEVSLNLRLV